jgi:hypothetical protein
MTTTAKTENSNPANLSAPTVLSMTDSPHPGICLEPSDVVEDDLQRPRLKNVCHADGGGGGGEGQRERAPVGAQQPRDFDVPLTMTG